MFFVPSSCVANGVHLTLGYARHITSFPITMCTGRL
jgi:hypothetical protein